MIFLPIYLFFEKALFLRAFSFFPPCGDLLCNPLKTTLFCEIELTFPSYYDIIKNKTILIVFA